MQVFGFSISNRAVEISIVMGVVLCAALLRIMDITTLSLWHDEAVSWSQSNRSFYDMLVQVSRDNYPPLHNIILNVVIRFFGDSEFALRLPSVIFGTLAVLFTFLIGQAILGFRIGIYAAILIAFSVFHIWYSTEVRMYALLSFTSALFFYYSLRAVQGKLADGYLALAGIALLYSHVYGAFLFASINLSVLVVFTVGNTLSRSDLWNWLKNQIIAFLVFAPWLVILASRSRTPNTSGFGWLPKPDAQFMMNHIITLFSGPVTATIFAMLALVAVVWAIFAPKFWITALKIQNANALRHAVFMLTVWLILPILIGYVLSVLYTPMIYNRYMIGAIVPMMILAAIGFYLLNLSKPYAIAIAIMIFVVIAPGRDELARPYFRGDVRPDMEQFNVLSQTGDTVYFPAWEVALFIYYANNPNGVNIKRQDDLPADADLPKRFWVINSVDYRSEEGLVDHLVSLGYSVRYQTKSKRLFSLFVKETGQ